VKKEFQISYFGKVPILNYISAMYSGPHFHAVISLKQFMTINLGDAGSVSN